MNWLKRSVLVTVVVLLGLIGAQTSASAATYSWSRANAWALIHAEDRQPDFNGCAWFVSRALWAGGVEMDDAWNNVGYRLGKVILPGTKTATVAEELYNHLRTRGMVSLQISDRYNPANTSVPEARPGDVIAYDWNADGHVDHVALVVHMAPNSYPEVSEWGSAPDGKVSPYERRGWSWSANHNTWQRAVHPGVRAYLVKIR